MGEQKLTSKALNESVKQDITCPWFAQHLLIPTFVLVFFLVVHICPNILDFMRLVVSCVWRHHYTNASNVSALITSWKRKWWYSRWWCYGQRFNGLWHCYIKQGQSRSLQKIIVDIQPISLTAFRWSNMSTLGGPWHDKTCRDLCFHLPVLALTDFSTHDARVTRM